MAAFNLIVRRASIRSQSHGASSALQSVRFSTFTGNNHTRLLESILGGYSDEAQRPLGLVHIDDSKVVLGRDLGRNFGPQATKVEVVGDTYKVIDDIPTVSIQATVDTDFDRRVCLEIGATAQPNTIRIHELKINTTKGNLREFHEHLGTKGIDLRMIGDLFDFFREQPEEE